MSLFLFFFISSSLSLSIFMSFFFYLISLLFDIAFNFNNSHISVLIMELFFTNSQLINAGSAQFDEFERKHILKTLRKKTGDSIDFTDGQGNLYSGHITRSHPELIVQYDQVTKVPAAEPRVHLGVGFIKQARLDYLVEKCTELGVSHFHLFAGKNSNYYTDNISRWEKITRQAIKQSLRYHLPGITCFKQLSDLIHHTRNIPSKFIAHQSDTGAFLQSLEAWQNESKSDIIILIGPEGGFTEDEIQLAQNEGFDPVSLGEHRLRTETAVISAISGINLFRIKNI